ncbi:hypothetical protein [Desulfobacula sp.]|uniref:hypothetical protein n=1 Tax=Desulfobacula sp. TaxID=2593537 RepID=UPI002613D0A5|nr:hypothetical protein [Desulfobacula sp.]
MATDKIRYRLNLILLLVVGFFATLWFYRHLRLYVTETVLLGGSITFWTLWKISSSLLNWTIGGNRKTLGQQLIGKPWATEYLMLALFPLAFLYATTASVYLSYEETQSGQSTFEVAVLNRGNPYIPPITVTSVKRVAGRPFFLNFGSIDLEYRIVNPKGYQSLQKRLAPWEANFLRVPRDFQKLNLVRLVPSPAVYSKLPRVEDPAGNRYYLDIEHKGTRFRLENFRRQIVYTGAPEGDLPILSEKGNSTLLRRELDDYLAGLGFPHKNREPVVAELLKNTTRLASTEFQNKDKIIVIVGEKSGDDSQGNGKQLLKTVYEIEDNAMQTIWLELQHD